MTSVDEVFLIRSFMSLFSLIFFFNLLMQAIKVEEHFHVQHVYATPMTYRISKGTSTNDTFKT